MTGVDGSGILDLAEWRQAWTAETWLAALEGGIGDVQIVERIREATRTEGEGWIGGWSSRVRGLVACPRNSPPTTFRLSLSSDPYSTQAPQVLGVQIDPAAFKGLSIQQPQALQQVKTDPQIQLAIQAGILQELRRRKQEEKRNGKPQPAAPDAGDSHE